MRGDVCGARPTDENLNLHCGHFVNELSLFAGCLLDSAPPDVPPRNPSMSRLNGRPGGLMGSMDRDGDFEPSCLVRTPSGNVYIPTGKLPQV